MHLVAEPLPGVKILKPPVFKDERGHFIKTFNEDQLASHGVRLDIREEFFTTSAANVIRGMHFQAPPHAHNKIIYCIKGRVIDVLLDLRADSPTLNEFRCFTLSEANMHIAYIPIGIAHGFLSQEDGSCLVYKVDTVYAPQSDSGVRWDSFGFEWPLSSGTPLISERDAALPTHAEFLTPF